MIGRTRYANARRKVRIADTWIHDEEPYGEWPPRMGLVRFPDGKLRIVRLNQTADTFFSVGARPSHGPAGFVTSDGDGFRFVAYDRGE